MKRFIASITCILMLMCFSSCDSKPEGNVDFGDYVIPSEADTTSKYEESQLINADNSWQSAYALSYTYYDKKTGQSTIAEGRCGKYYQSLDYATNITTFMSQEDGYIIQYMLDSNTKKGTAAVVTDGSMDSLHSGFMLLSVCDPYFPVYTNVKKVGSDYENLKYNTAIAAMMALLNEFYRKNEINRAEFKTLLVLLNPVAPHITEELWERSGYEGRIYQTQWPEYEESKTVEATIEIAVQINGKTRAVVALPADVEKDAAIAAGKEALGNKLTGHIVKEIYVPGRIINIVAK